MTPLLTSAYLAPIHYYAHLLAAPRVVEERSEHYVKQTYRNRCVIATADGPQSLTIPVQGRKDLGGDSKTPTREMRLSEHGRWRELHWNALVAAYERTPFFEFYADDFAAIYKNPPTEGATAERLVDFNASLQQLVLRLLDIHPQIDVNEGEYLQCAPTSPQEWCDYRELIRPKIHYSWDAAFQPVEYYQVFSQRHGFLPNLSIVDLLFNMGPESRMVLRKSIVKL